MSKVAIVTDSNSGITQEQGKELGIFVLPKPSDRFSRMLHVADYLASRKCLESIS